MAATPPGSIPVSEWRRANKGRRRRLALLNRRIRRLRGWIAHLESIRDTMRRSDEQEARFVATRGERVSPEVTV